MSLNIFKHKDDTEKEKKVVSNTRLTVRLIVVIAVAAALVTLLLLYLNKVNYYSKHFYMGTHINGADVSDMTAEETEEVLQESIDRYQMELRDVDGRSYVIAAPDLEMKYTCDGSIEELMESQNPGLWIITKNSPLTGTIAEKFSYNQENLVNWFMSLPCVTEGAAPTDAYKEMGEDGYWYIVPETAGNKIDVDKAIELLKETVSTGNIVLQLNYDECYVKPSIYSSDTALVEEVNTLNKQIERQKRIEEITDVTVSVAVNIDGETRQSTLTPDDLKTMIVDDENGNPIVSGDQVIQWVKKWAQDNNLLDDKYLFVNCYGTVMHLDNGADTGWMLDVDATAQSVYTAIDKLDSKTVDPVLVGAESGEPLNKQTYVEIIIPEQRMICYQDGVAKVDTPIVTGAVVNELSYSTITPTNGIWHINFKKMNHHMKGPQLPDGSYEYETDVEFWLPFNGSIGIHDKQDRGAFGGDIYILGGSHGCINTPYNAAKEIYSIVSKGTPVIVWGDNPVVEVKENENE